MAILHLAAGIVGLLAAIAIFVFVGLAGGIVAYQGEHGVAGIIGLVAVVLGGFLAVLALPSLLGGWALMTGRPWGRIVVLILAALHIAHFPFGTALGVYTFWALLYEPPPPALPASTIQPGA
ncbi:MAG TPA: hypothetical protein VGO11_10790 [Chthoniobacteraceae bacterium]|nr:hypothetical protein [Chthoniobacteraceae bacterium]